MITEETLMQQTDIQNAVNWIKAQAKIRQVSIQIPVAQIEERQADYYTFIRIPLDAPALDTGELINLLTDLEFEWNDQEPRPEKLLFLYPAGVPRCAI